MEFIITNIQYDTDGVSAKSLGLPKELKIIVPDECDGYDEIEQYISDEISNQTGYCHKGYATTPQIPD